MAEETIKPEVNTEVVEATTTPSTEATTAAAPAPVKRKKGKRTVSSGQVHVYASFNNTIITFTDSNGGALTASSAGACGFRGSKKGTAYAAQVAAEKAAEMVQALHGMKSVDVFVKGVGLGRDSAVRALTNFNIQVDSIKDVTGVPHGGTRPRKARRV